MQDPTGRLDILAWRIAERLLAALEPSVGLPLRGLLMPGIIAWAEETFGTEPLWRAPLCSSEQSR